MHLEDLTSLPLKVIYQRALDMSLKYVSEMGERVSSRSLGQFVIHKTEDAIWTLEKSIEWSAPPEAKPAQSEVPDKKEMNGSHEKQDAPDVRPSRPLPWIFFLPVLVVLTGTRIAYEAASSMLGKTPVTPADMVHFLRSQRRSLRAMRIRGKRIMKTRVPSTFSTVMSFVNPLKILGVLGFTSKKESKRDLEVSTRSQLHEEDDDKENVLEKLNRLSKDLDSIEDDPDFQPDSTMSSETSTSSSSGDASEESEDVETPRATRTSSFIADIIQEEDEELEDVSSNTEPATPSFTVGDKFGDSISQVSENSDFSSLSASTPKVYPDLCDSHDSAIKHISTVFNQGLTPQSSF